VAVALHHLDARERGGGSRPRSSLASLDATAAGRRSREPARWPRLRSEQTRVAAKPPSRRSGSAGQWGACAQRQAAKPRYPRGTRSCRHLRIPAVACSTPETTPVQALLRSGSHRDVEPDCHGKEGVAGSSPAEGSTKPAGNGGFRRGRRFAVGPHGPLWKRLEALRGERGCCHLLPTAVTGLVSVRPAPHAPSFLRCGRRLRD
jgi:hypothetical protein